MFNRLRSHLNIKLAAARSMCRRKPSLWYAKATVDQTKRQYHTSITDIETIKRFKEIEENRSKGKYTDDQARTAAKQVVGKIATDLEANIDHCSFFAAQVGELDPSKLSNSFATAKGLMLADIPASRITLIVDVGLSNKFKPYKEAQERLISENPFACVLLVAGSTKWSLHPDSRQGEGPRLWSFDMASGFEGWAKFTRGKGIAVGAVVNIHDTPEQLMHNVRVKRDWGCNYLFSQPLYGIPTRYQQEYLLSLSKQGIPISIGITTSNVDACYVRPQKKLIVDFPESKNPYSVDHRVVVRGDYVFDRYSRPDRGKEEGLTLEHTQIQLRELAELLGWMARSGLANPESTYIRDLGKNADLFWALRGTMFDCPDGTEVNEKDILAKYKKYPWYPKY